jgi:predicted ATPase
VDIRKKLSEKYKEKNRYKNFGPIIASVKINGFRGVNTEINFDYPITALSGLNGSGKSTVGQLMLCAYRKMPTSKNSKRFYVKDFFPVSNLDPEPFSSSAKIEFFYETDKPSSKQELTITRSKKEWSGYKRQPERNVEYLGFTVYIPKIEQRDLSIYLASSLSVDEEDRIDVENGASYASRILGSNYEDIYFQGVKAKSRSAELGMAHRFGAKYSENNMGFGEGRVVYTIRLLESCPAQSLIVLEEPETSLHESAQYEFIKYLMDVVDRRGHQIIFSTHSSIMMDALPSEGRKLLVRGKDGVDVFDSVTSTRVKTALSCGEKGHTIICVEDEFAQSFLREILRRYDINVLESVEIIPFGDAKAVLSAQRVLAKARQKAIAVRDADQGEDLAQHLLSLPGSLPPEKEVFCSEASKNKLSELYRFSADTFLSAYPDIDHHDYFPKIAEKLSCSREVLETDCIRAFLDSAGPTWSQKLCENIRKTIV